MRANEADLRIPANRLAAAARALQPTLMRLIALRADQISRALEAEHGIVPWDREQLIGQLQRQLMELADARFRVRGGPIVHVRERRSQPLEAIPRAWRWLREGRRVYVDAEPGACSQTLVLLAQMGEVLGFHVLMTSRDATSPPDGAVDGGVALAPRRLTLIASQADEELAAYVLARACLRRSGLDPRAVHVAIVTGDGRTLGRILRRLWFSVRFSEAGDHGAFAGPVSQDVARGLEEAMARLEGRSDVACWVPLRRLEGTSGMRGCLMAPTLWATTVGLDRGSVEQVMACFPEVGPALLVLRERDASSASRLLSDLVGAGYRWTLIGPRTAPETVGLREPPLSVFDGALLEERLPPGLPKPRP
jgi:hypothetical protein